MMNVLFNFLQPTLSNHRDQYNISWVVQSYAPILEYRLFYRKQTGNGNVNPTSNNDVIHYEKYVCIQLLYSLRMLSTRSFSLLNTIYPCVSLWFITYTPCSTSPFPFMKNHSVNKLFSFLSLTFCSYYALFVHIKLFLSASSQRGRFLPTLKINKWCDMW